MENQTEFPDEESLNVHPQIDLINNFCEITTCASKSEALFFLESHNFDLDAAVSTFLDNSMANASVVSAADLVQPEPQPDAQDSPSEDDSASPSRSRSPSPALASRSHQLRSSANPNAAGRLRKVDSRGDRGGGSGGRGGRSIIRTLADLNKNPRDDGSDSDDPDFNPQEYFTGGAKSGMLVQGPKKTNKVDKIFKKARESGGSSEQLPSSSRSYFGTIGTARVLSGEPSSTSTTPQPPETVNHNITFWGNGFTVDDGPLRRLDDPANASFLKSMSLSECPAELAPANKGTQVQVSLTRKEEDYPEPKKHQSSFHGVGRTLGSTSDEVVAPVESNPISTPSLTVAPTAVLGLVVDQTQPSTSIQLRLADGTRMVSRFNNHHTVRDIRGFIDASRPAGSRAPYQLQTMGFPPKQLTEVDQTIDEAGIANSVVIQKLL